MDIGGPDDIILSRAKELVAEVTLELEGGKMDTDMYLYSSHVQRQSANLAAQMLKELGWIVTFHNGGDDYGYYGVTWP